MHSLTNYEFLEVIGHGSFATVYKAINLVLFRLIKVVIDL